MKRGTPFALMIVALVSAAWAAPLPPTRMAQTRVTRPAAKTALLAARKALFETSQLDDARAQAKAALQQAGDRVEPVFLEMETAALQADVTGELQAALQLCELRGTAQRDPRVTIAAARLLDLAGNSEEFRSAIPRIQALLAATSAGRAHAQVNYLRAALVAAAADGAPGVSLRQAARQAGLVTEWRIAGPFGEYSNLDFDRVWAPEHDQLAEAASDGHAVERVRFDDGTFELPEYFPRSGVFYAAAELRISAGSRWLLRAESPGTLEVFVDGDSVLRKDDRLRVTPEMASRPLRLKSGIHRVLIKFIPPTLRFRIAFLPQPAPERARMAAISYPPEARYLQAATKYWEGDYQGALADLNGGARSALTNYLSFQAWDHVAEGSPEATAMLNATVSASPAAWAAEYELAQRAYSAERTDEALSRLKVVLAARPNFAPAQQLMADIAIRLHWPAEAAEALEIRIRLRPDCKALREAQKFFAAHARYESAQELSPALENCAPDALAYAQSLSESGEHAQAAAAARQVVAKEPLDRVARELLVRELALAGETRAAAEAARELAAMAPNSARYQRVAHAAETNPDELLDEPGALGSDFGRSAPFYAPYRRDGLSVARQAADRHFSGGPALTLVSDRVARFAPDGSVEVYVHQLTRMLDRDGIERYGEVELPRSAQVLELRTIKADGSVLEPEFQQEKANISMPGLAPGDVIEQEYVLRYADGEAIAGHADALQHTFGSFKAPILYSRFAIIAPATKSPVQVTTSGDVPGSRAEVRNGMMVRVWEKDDIPQSVEEVASARGDILPTVRVEPVWSDGWRGVRDHYANLLVDALRAGPQVQRAAEHIRGQQPEDKAREIYRFIVGSIRPAEFQLEDMPSAEETLADRTGSRTAALLAVARAAGLDADLVLARNAGTLIHPGRQPILPSLDVYTRPLVRFRFDDGHGGNRELVVDAETDGLAFGALPPDVVRHDALLVSMRPAAAESPLAALPSSTVGNQSLATADVTLDSTGALSAQVSIVLGAWRASQMRSILADIEPSQRAHFFQQLAGRIFAGAEDVSGQARHENDPDQPLQIVLHCRAPHFVNLAAGPADMDQLVPTLGLKKMYVGATERKFPLYVDTPLFEIARFRVHLPAGFSASVPPAMNVSSEFGSYSLSFRETAPQEILITRSFHIPVQVIPSQQFGDFARFASRIDDAERQRLTLEPAAAQGSGSAALPAGRG